MSIDTGLDAQVGLVAESAFGTYVAPTRFIDFVSESLALKIERVESKAIRKGQRIMRTEDWANGTRTVEGDIEFELWNKSFGLIFQAMFGAVSTAGTAAPYTHTFIPGDLDPLTIQVGRPSVGGTVHPFSYTGCIVDSWEINSDIGEPVNLKLTLVGQDETTSESLATASYASSPELLTFVGGSVSVSGASVDVKKVSIKGENGLNKERYFLGSALHKVPLEAAQRNYEIEAECEFTDLTLYNKFVAGDEATVVVSFAGVDNPTHRVTVSANVRFDGDTPTVGGTDIVPQTLKMKVIDSGSVSISLVYVTSDATP